MVNEILVAWKPIRTGRGELVPSGQKSVNLLAGCAALTNEIRDLGIDPKGNWKVAKESFQFNVEIVPSNKTPPVKKNGFS